MKYLLLPFTLILAGCEAFNAALADPVVQEKIIHVVKEAETAVSSGDWTNTEIGATSAAGALVIATITKWLHGRLKKSEPGQVI